MQDAAGTVWFFYGNILTGLGMWFGSLKTMVDVAIWNFVNSIFGNIFIDIDFMSFVSDFSKNPLVNVLVSLTTILSVGFIVLKYGYIIFKSYFLNMDGQLAVPTMDFFKRVFYALLLVLIAPTIVCNIFIFSSYAGNAVAKTFLSSDTQESKDIYIKSFYRDVEKYGIEPLTICYDNLDDWDVTEKNEILNLGFPKVLKVDDEKSKQGNIYERWCSKELTNEELEWKGKRPAVIMQTLVDNDSQPWIMKWKGSLNGNLIDIAQLIIIAISSIGIVIMTVFRISDLLSAILMMWYYAQAYVSEVNNTMISSFIKSIASVCLTQFFTISMYGIITAMLLNEQLNIHNILIIAALLFMMIKGPSTIRTILSDSGALQAGRGAANSVRKGIGG